MSVATEKRISLHEAAEELGVTANTVRNYCVHGLNGIVLEHIARPRKFETSHEAIVRFLEQMLVTPNPDTLPTKKKTQLSHAERRQALKAEAAGYFSNR